MPTSMRHIAPDTPMGANLVENGATFRVWAPSAIEVHILGDFNAWTRGPASLLQRDERGHWAGFVEGAREFQEYKFYVVGRGSEGFKRDPYARELSDDWPSSNCILRSPAFPWNDAPFRTPDFRNYAIYQLHVGTFLAPRAPARPGTFLDVASRIEYLDDLGVTCIQLLPIVEFQTRFSMGYNGTDYFAPEMGFAVPEADLDPYLTTVNRLLEAKGCRRVARETLRGAVNQLKMLINLCHVYGIAVTLDVVYNHAGGEFGDESLYFFDRDHDGDLNRSLYFTDRGHAGGLVFAVWKEEVRQFLIDNARYFLDEYHADGLRYDQVSVLVEESRNDGWRFWQDITSTTRFANPERFDKAEYWPTDIYVTKPVAEGGAGFDAMLTDGLRDSVRRALAGAALPGDHPLDMSGIAAAVRPADSRGRAIEPPWKAVQAIETHDEVYRDRHPRIPRLADGSNSRSWHARSRSRVALGLVLFAPGIPMLFMGQEFLEDKQWSDDIENYAGNLIHWAGLESGEREMVDMHRFTREALGVRFSEPALRADGVNAFHVHDANRVLAFHRWVPGEGRDAVVVASLRNETHWGYAIGFPQPGHWREAFNSDVFDNWVNPWVAGNGSGVEANGPPMHGLPASARIVIPGNSVLVFARA